MRLRVCVIIITTTSTTTTIIIIIIIINMVIPAYLTLTSLLLNLCSEI